ncbi:MAG: heparan-alpha-glucosaminide N-acetyltransferase domain-containing protein [Chitinophagaceae bacterium]
MTNEIQPTIKTITMTNAVIAGSPMLDKSKRVESIDLLRGIVMIIMAIDHVRDYFSYEAFIYSPTDLSKTNVFLFFTRWITHYCAPIFVFLAGVSAHLYGVKRTKKQLALFLLTRGLWLVFAECFIVTLGWTFNPTYPVFNLQVIWAIGISMVFMSALIFLNLRVILTIGILLIAGHNLIDTVHVPGNGASSILWSMIHDEGDFKVGHLSLFIHYPILPWLGIMAIGYYFGKLYTYGYDPEMRRTILLSLGIGSIVLFILLRLSNVYGDASHWAIQNNAVFTFLSFLNVTKYPPSLLYALMTIGPALLFLGLSEKSLGKWGKRITVFGRVPFFYYILHIALIHLLAIGGAMILGYSWTDMILHNRVNRTVELKGYGFNIGIVYMVWAAVILILYPLCKKYDRYKRANQSTKWWLSYV